MSQWRKRPVVVEAHRWYKNGDHPDDAISMAADGFPTEGVVVRYFRHPEIPGGSTCRSPQPCGYAMHEHGWIDTLEGGHTVCPGDWIVTGVKGERYPVKPDIFDATYEPAGTPTPAPQGAPRDVSENCDICGHGDEVDPRAAVSFGPNNLVAHPQCLFDAADSIYRTELGCSPTDKGAPRFTPEERRALGIAADKIDAVQKQMHDAPYDYAELMGDWHQELRDATSRIRALLQEGAGG